MMKRLVFTLLACLACAGCADSYSEPQFSTDSGALYDHGCVVVEDDFGSRQVCDVDYAYYQGYPVYYDSYFGVWIWTGMGGGYWRGGAFYSAYPYGYHTYYHAGFYHASGYYGHQVRYHGGGGGYHGGGFHGGGGRGGGRR